MNKAIMVRTLGIAGIVVMLTAGCVVNGPLPVASERVAVNTLEKDDPEKSFGEIMLERMAEGNFRRRVIGWIDRAT